MRTVHVGDTLVFRDGARYPSWSGSVVFEVEGEKVQAKHPLWGDGLFYMSELDEISPSPSDKAPVSEGVGSEVDQPKAPTLFTGNCPPGTKDDNAKESFRYMPWSALREVNLVLMYGARKYAPDNWLKVDDGKMRYWDAAMRHLTAWKDEGPRDTGPKGSGLRHLAHAATCCLFALWFEIKEEKETKE